VQRYKQTRAFVLISFSFFVVMERCNPEVLYALSGMSKVPLTSDFDIIVSLKVGAVKGCALSETDPPRHTVFTRTFPVHGHLVGLLSQTVYDVYTMVGCEKLSVGSHLTPYEDVGKISFGLDDETEERAYLKLVVDNDDEFLQMCTDIVIFLFLCYCQIPLNKFNAAIAGRLHPFFSLPVLLLNPETYTDTNIGKTYAVAMAKRVSTELRKGYGADAVIRYLPADTKRPMYLAYHRSAVFRQPYPTTCQIITNTCRDDRHYREFCKILDSTYACV